MVYLLYGLSNYLIDNQIKKISKGIDNLNISHYNLDIDDFSLVIDDAETFSMFQDRKLIIAENANVFTSGVNKDGELIQNYLMNLNPSTILVFVVRTEKIDGRKKITNLIKSKGKVIELNNEVSVDVIIKDELKGYNIDYNDIILLKERVSNNPFIIKNEIEKIKLFKGENRDISSMDIINLINKSIDTDIFKFIDNIIKKNREEAISMYHNMLIMKEEPLKIIVMLADQFRIMYQAKELMMKGHTEKSITDILKIHPYRVKLAIQNGRSYGSRVLLKYINDLAELDIGIKTGTLNKDLALELFLLKL